MQNFGAASRRNYYIKAGFFLLLVAWLAYLMAGKINLVTADLGRHIKNGEWVVMNHFNLSGGDSPVHENFYSYTHAEFPVINHHWGAGVIFFLIFKFAGFSGLSVFNIFLAVAAFAIFFHIAVRESNFAVAFLLSIFLIPLIAERREVRPEIFSYFFAAVFFFALWSWQRKKLAASRLFVLPVLMILWVNLHVYFFLGLFLIGLFWLAEFAQVIFSKMSDEEFREKISRVKMLTIVSIIATAASLLNPFGWKGLLYPLQIFKNYGYTIVENKSVGFVEAYGIQNPNFLLIKAVLITLIVSFVLLFLVDRKNISTVHLILAAFFGAIGWIAVRNFTLLGFFALPVLVANLQHIFTPDRKNNPQAKENGLVIICLAIGILAVYANYQFVAAHSSERGIGLFPEIRGAADFLKKENISGPIFNDYDIGGYLIFSLPEKEKVFVDNRPEAYPDAFFTDIYKPMQENAEVFEKIDGEYNFNAIVFYLNDITPWGQNFLKIVRQMDNWKAVYKDDYAIIYLKRNDANSEIINKYQFKD